MPAPEQYAWSRPDWYRLQGERVARIRASLLAARREGLVTALPPLMRLLTEESNRLPPWMTP